MTQVRSWLPASVFTTDRATIPVASAVREWSAAWIATETWHIIGGWELAEITLGDEWTSLRGAGAWAVLGEAGSIVALAAAILGCGDQPAHARDLKLMRRVAGEALDDLVSRIEQKGFATAPADGDDSHCTLAIGGRTAALRLLCPQSSLTAMLKGGFERTTLASRLVPRNASLADVDTTVGVLLGRASLSVDGLQSLECGDVLVLDRNSAGPLNLIVADRPTDLSGKIIERRGRLALEIQELA